MPTAILTHNKPNETSYSRQQRSAVSGCGPSKQNGNKKERVGTKSKRGDFFAIFTAEKNMPLQLNFCVAAASQCENKTTPSIAV